jgi:hypothetical protein
MPDVTGFQLRSSRISLAVGALVFAIALASGFTVAAARGQKWSATSADIVLPSSKLDSATSAGYYESLSRGQVVATVAEILRLRSLKTSAADALSLSPSQRSNLAVNIQAVPETALVQIAVSSPERQVAGRMADAMLAEANAYFRSGWSDEVFPALRPTASRAGGEGLLSPYTLTPVSSGLGNEQRVGISTVQFGVVALLVAIVAGFAAQQATQQLGLLLAPRRPAVGALHPVAAAPADPGDLHEPGNGAIPGGTWASPPRGGPPSRLP